ncbi:MAG: NUDIX hydrolase [Actinomycetaceae bacterium]|nr:NUDIX hydrolase [Actinomycetaceae bacterium]MDU0969614.1 NUDIX hydrolase [Actinomycetaceae bacterium]
MIEDTPAHAKVASRRTIYEGAAFTFCTDDVVFDDSDHPVARDYIAHPGAVAIVAVREGDAGPEICVVNQYRHPVGMRLWEVPAGLTDAAGESLLDAAQRELAEEAGLGARSWATLADFYTSPGGSTEGLRIFLARDLYPREAEGFVREAEEAEMECRFVPLDELLAGIVSGHLHNPSLLVGVLALAHARSGGLESLRPADAPWEGTCAHGPRAGV